MKSPIVDWLMLVAGLTVLWSAKANYKRKLPGVWLMLLTAGMIFFGLALRRF
jgi:hypothetical protein